MQSQLPGVASATVSMFVGWVPAVFPPAVPDKYVVVVCQDYFGMRYLNTRTWDGKRWHNTAASERIESWLDGLVMP